LSTPKESKEIQYQKIWDTPCLGILFSGLGSLSAAIAHPWSLLEILSIGVACVIIGAVIIISWKKFYEYRISLLKWIIILLVFDLIVATILLLATPPSIQEKLGFYLLDVIAIIFLIIISAKKRNQLYGYAPVDI
jgi:hypothetical protein